MRHSAISGIIPILATPFDTDGSLDTRSLRRLVEFQLNSGVDGVAVFGLASEGFALTADERAKILHEVRSVVSNAVPVVAGIGATSTVTALEQASEAIRGGADVLMALPPFMVKPSPGQIFDFFGTLSSETGADIMVQDAPGVTGVTMPVALVGDLSQVLGVSSIKVESPPTATRMASIVAEVPNDFLVFGGQNAQMLIEEYEAGAVGTMPACEFSDLLVPILNLLATGKLQEADDAFTRLLPLILFGLQPGLAWAVHKEALVMRGIIDTARVRSPASPIDNRTRAALRRILHKLELIRPESQ